jgi:hypothetical protein
MASAALALANPTSKETSVSYFEKLKQTVRAFFADPFAVRFYGLIAILVFVAIVLWVLG